MGRTSVFVDFLRAEGYIEENINFIYFICFVIACHAYEAWFNEHIF